MSDWIKHAETKLSILLAFLGALAAGLVALVTGYRPVGAGSLIVCAASALLIAASAVLASIGLVPRLGTKTSPSPSLLYFGDVARHQEDEAQYHAGLAALLANPDDLAGEIARQIYANSRVAWHKFIWLRRAIWVGVIALFAVMGTGAGCGLFELNRAGARAASLT